MGNTTILLVFVNSVYVKIGCSVFFFPF